VRAPKKQSEKHLLKSLLLTRLFFFFFLSFLINHFVMIVKLIISLQCVQLGVNEKTNNRRKKNVCKLKRASRLKAITNDYLPCGKITFIYSRFNRVLFSLLRLPVVSYSLLSQHEFISIVQEVIQSLLFVAFLSRLKFRSQNGKTQRETVTKQATGKRSVREV
jgi:hypothetical protein